MAINKDPLFIGVITGKLTQFASGSATTEQTIFSGDATYATRIDAVSVYTTDTADKDLMVLLHDGTNSREVGIVKIPLSSGNTNAIVAVNILGSTQIAGLMSFDSGGKPFINLPPGWSLRAKFTADLTSAKVANVVARGGKYSDA